MVPPTPPPNDRADSAATDPPGDEPLTKPVGTVGILPETERRLTIPEPEVDTKATLTVLSGPEAGRVVAVTSKETILGREVGAQLVVEDTTVSRRHARIVTEGDAFVLEDLGSTNGTFVRGAPTTRSPLVSGDRIQLGANTLLRFAVTDRIERAMLQRLVESSTRDALTGAFNRAFLEQRLAAEIAYAKRHGSKLAVLLLDLDEFKLVNDKHGHGAGDEVLRAVARKVSATLRCEDLLARYGGEEFAIIARAADHFDPLRLAERIRATLEREPIQLEAIAPIRVTVSIGIAQLAEDLHMTPDQLLRVADARLYRAKSSGRNLVCAAD